ncbi:G-type lectin S-receptor-like serine/threonine-protein kinase At1g11410 [Camellia sinensis]|uniref:G-type lectin S-receptor-like serine/threonine-protein kinase At1g11410 n=1 Tax=Camellia sinensis TaxID=4442 RepID=UPI00103577E9|nr:G-type lectin S-receptor-like serine/threonine-protein kinase At1g11410 [Camellia sinensis]
MKPEKWVFNARLLPLFLFFGLCNSTDTMTSTQPIKDGDLLVSNGETFALGFFSPGNGTSNRRYVGIWYYKISEQTVVWVANRDNPINGMFGALAIDQDGNLVIYDDNSQNIVTKTFWQTNVSASSSNSARLLDSGNLVLFQGGDDTNGSSSTSSVIAWQSFDYPTHTMLPNMKLGLDRRTGLNRFLTSWKSHDDPGTGEYSFRRDTRGLPQSFVLKGSARIWRTGPWIGNKWSGTPKLINYIFNVSYIDNNEEFSVMYSLINASVMSMMFLDEFGYLQRYTWHEDKAVWFMSAPKEPCDFYGRCGPYGNCDPNNGEKFDCTCLPGYEPRSARDCYLEDGSAGCRRKRGGTISMCNNGEGFVKVARVKVPDTSEVAHSDVNLSKEVCEDKCLRNCSCSAYISDGGICITWYGNLMDTRVFSNGGSDLYVRVDAVELAQQYTKKPRSLHGKVVAIVVTSIVVMSLLIMIPLVCWLVIRKRRRGDDIQISDEEKVELSIFDMVTISKATNKFCDANKIGEGAFGPVYKVSLFHSYTSYFSGQMKSFTRKTYYNLSHDDQTKSLYCLS